MEEEQTKRKLTTGRRVHQRREPSKISTVHGALTMLNVGSLVKFACRAYVAKKKSSLLVLAFLCGEAIINYILSNQLYRNDAQNSVKNSLLLPQLDPL